MVVGLVQHFYRPSRPTDASPSLFAVETLNLSKRYGKTDALRGLNFTVNEGEIMVILGPKRLRQDYPSHDSLHDSETDIRHRQSCWD